MSFALDSMAIFAVHQLRNEIEQSADHHHAQVHAAFAAARTRAKNRLVEADRALRPAFSNRIDARVVRYTADIRPFDRSL